MNPHYPEIATLLRQVGAYEKVASAASVSAQSAACSMVYDTFMKRASTGGNIADPVVNARDAIIFARELNSTALTVGEKVAYAQAASDALEQLGAVVFLDTTLKQAAESMSGSALESTQQLQLLGREYGVELLKTLVG